MCPAQKGCGQLEEWLGFCVRALITQLFDKGCNSSFLHSFESRWWSLVVVVPRSLLCVTEVLFLLRVGIKWNYKRVTAQPHYTRECYLLLSVNIKPSMVPLISMSLLKPCLAHSDSPAPCKFWEPPVSFHSTPGRGVFRDATISYERHRC